MHFLEINNLGPTSLPPLPDAARLRGSELAKHPVGLAAGNICSESESGVTDDACA